MRELPLIRWCTFFLLAIFLVTGCSSGAGRIYVNMHDYEALAQDDSKKKGEPPLRIVVSPSLSNRDTVGYYRQLAEHIAIQTGQPTELIYRRSNAEAQALLATNGADVFFFSTGTYLTYNGPVELEILVVPARDQGPFYQALIIVPNDSSVEDFADLAEKSFAFNDSLSFSGYLFPLHLLKQLNKTPENFFRQTVFTQSHSKSLQAVAMHMIEGAAIDSIALDHAGKNAPEVAKAVRVVHFSQPVGTGPVVIRKAMNEARKELLKTVFLNMHHNQDMKKVLQELMFERFILAPDKLYEYPRRIMAEMKGLP